MWVDGGWRDDDGVAVVAECDFPSVVVDGAVAFAADEGEVVHVGGAAIPPEDDMVEQAPVGGAPAHDAAVIPKGDGDALGGGGEAGCPTHREWNSVVVDDDRGQVGIAAQ